MPMQMHNRNRSFTFVSLVIVIEIATAVATFPLTPVVFMTVFLCSFVLWLIQIVSDFLYSLYSAINPQLMNFIDRQTAWAARLAMLTGTRCSRFVHKYIAFIYPVYTLSIFYIYPIYTIYYIICLHLQWAAIRTRTEGSYFVSDDDFDGGISCARVSTSWRVCV